MRPHAADRGSGFPAPPVAPRAPTHPPPWGHVGYADSTPAKGCRGLPSRAWHAESRPRAGCRGSFGRRSCCLGASLLGDPAAPPPRASQRHPPVPLTPAPPARQSLLRPGHRAGEGLGLTLQASARLRNACRPVLTHLTDLPLSYWLHSAWLSLQLM